MGGACVDALRGQQTIDALDPEGMPEMNCFPSRSRGHRPALRRLGASICCSIGGPCALFRQLAIAFSANARIWPYAVVNIAHCLVFRGFVAILRVDFMPKVIKRLPAKAIEHFRVRSLGTRNT